MESRWSSFRCCFISMEGRLKQTTHPLGFCTIKLWQEQLRSRIQHIAKQLTTFKTKQKHAYDQIQQCKMETSPHLHVRLPYVATAMAGCHQYQTKTMTSWTDDHVTDSSSLDHNKPRANSWLQLMYLKYNNSLMAYRGFYRIHDSDNCAIFIFRRI